MERTNHLRIILAIILVSYVMGVLDVSIVITALPKIQRSFNASPALLSWIQNAYTLALGGFLLLGARSGDILGRRRVFMVGMAIFTGASVLIGFAQSLEFMLIARAIQGFGAAMLTPSTLALLSTNFPEGQARNRAVSYYGAMAGVGTSFGLVLGGFLADALSWRVGFFINLPIGVAMMLLARKYIPETERSSGDFDLLGALSSTLGMTALVFGIERSVTSGWTDAVTLGSLVASSVLLTFFVWNERRAKQPILPLRLFANRKRIGGYVGRGLFLGGMMGFWFFMSQFLQAVMGYSALAAGAAFLPMTIISFGSAMAVPKLVQKYGNGQVAAAGLLITLLGMFWLTGIHTGVAYVSGIALPMVLIGIGQGACLGPLTGAGMTDIAPEDAGAGSGLVNSTQQLGGSLGLSLLVVVFSYSSSASLAQRVSTSLFGSTALLAIALGSVVLLIVRPAAASRKRKCNVPLPEAA